MSCTSRKSNSNNLTARSSQISNADENFKKEKTLVLILTPEDIINTDSKKLNLDFEKNYDNNIIYSNQQFDEGKIFSISSTLLTNNGLISLNINIKDITKNCFDN